jgi:hypothetical protein
MYFLEARTRFIFDGIPVGPGLAKVVWERPALDHEHYYNLNIRHATTEFGYIDIHCDPSLIGEDGLPDYDGKLQDKDGAAIASQISTSLLDTFDNSLLLVDTGLSVNKVGFQISGSDDLLSREKNFSLFKLMMCSDVQTYLDHGIITSMEDVSISFYLNGVLKHKIVLEQASIAEKVLYVYGKKKEAEVLKDNPYFFEYTAREASIAISGFDYCKYLLENLSVGDVIDAENMSSQALHQWTNLILWETGDDTIGIINTDEAAWNGMGTREFMTMCYNRAFARYQYFDMTKYKTAAPQNFDRTGNYWNYQVDDSLARYICSKIPASSFVTLGAAYAWYLKKRHYEIADATHKVTDKFNLLDAEKDEIWLHESFFREYNFQQLHFGLTPHVWGNNPTDGINDKEYCFRRYENIFQATTRIANSNFYYSRFSYKEGAPFVQHLFKKRRPPLVKIPLNVKGGQTIEPTSEFNRFVEGQSYGKFGKQAPYRLAKTGGTGDNRPVNFFKLLWAQYADLIEPGNDKSRFLIKWREDQWGWYHHEDVEFNENAKRFATDVQPFVNGAQPIDGEKIYVTKSFFGLFGSLCVCVLGCQFDGETPEHDGFIFEGLISNKFGVGDIEFTWVVIGTNAENCLPRLEPTTNTLFSSGYPGLILFAGGSADQGKTIDINEAGSFYRGCVQIEFPWGDPDENGVYQTYLSSVGGLQAQAMFMSQFKLGNLGRIKLEIPSLDNYENELGETGYDAIYEGLGVELYGNIYLIEGIKKSWKKDTIILDLVLIPPADVLPELFDYDISVFSNGCGSYRKFGANYQLMTDSAQVFDIEYNKTANGACS